MLLRYILCLVGTGVHQFQIHLQRCIAQESAQLGLCGDLGGHQIQQHDLQRANILGAGPILGHNKYIFLLQRRSCRQVIRDPNGHRNSPYVCFYDILPQRIQFVNSCSRIVVRQDLRIGTSA